MGFVQGCTGRATVVLRGQHVATVNVYAAGSAEARMSVLWATAMLTFTTADQVAALATALGEASGVVVLVPSRVARGVFEQFVPRYGVSTTAATLGQTPAVTVTPHAATPTGGGGWAHRMRWIDVDAGPLTFWVLDREGFTTLTEQLDDAATLAAATLRPAQVRPRVPGAAPAPTDQH